MRGERRLIDLGQLRHFVRLYHAPEPRDHAEDDVHLGFRQRCFEVHAAHARVPGRCDAHDVAPAGSRHVRVVEDDAFGAGQKTLVEDASDAAKRPPHGVAVQAFVAAKGEGFGRAGLSRAGHAHEQHDLGATGGDRASRSTGAACGDDARPAKLAEPRKALIDRDEVVFRERDRFRSAKARDGGGAARAHDGKDLGPHRQEVGEEHVGRAGAAEPARHFGEHPILAEPRGAFGAAERRVGQHFDAAL